MERVIGKFKNIFRALTAGTYLSKNVLMKVFHACAGFYNWLIDFGDIEWEELDDAVVSEVESLNAQAEVLNTPSKAELNGGAGGEMGKIVRGF